MVYLFVLCTTLFVNSYYNVTPQNLSFIDDMENFDKYRKDIDIYKEILRELDPLKGKPNCHQRGLIVIKGAKREDMDLRKKGSLRVRYCIRLDVLLSFTFLPSSTSFIWD